MSEPLEKQVESLLSHPRPYSREWLDQAADVLVQVADTRRRALIFHRRCQRAEAAALREGRRADRLAHRLREIDAAARAA